MQHPLVNTDQRYHEGCAGAPVVGHPPIVFPSATRASAYLSNALNSSYGFISARLRRVSQWFRYTSTRGLRCSPDARSVNVMTCHALAMRVVPAQCARDRPTSGPWGRLLAQALEELLLEEPDAAVLPAAYVRNWLGEWSREVRRRQQGLLLTSAHRAKGLEFDHVVMLDGKWNATNPREDEEAPRRLYFVAMTRARETLALVDLDDHSERDSDDPPLAASNRQRAATLIQPLKARPCTLERQVPSPDTTDPRLHDETVVCTMGTVFMDFAGRLPADDETHQAISALKPGDALSLTRQNARWKMLDRHRREVGRMRADWDVPKGVEVVDATVHGVFLRWVKDVKDDRYARNLQANSWEMVIPTLTLASRHVHKRAH